MHHIIQHPTDFPALRRTTIYVNGKGEADHDPHRAMLRSLVAAKSVSLPAIGGRG